MAIFILGTLFYGVCERSLVRREREVDVVIPREIFPRNRGGSALEHLDYAPCQIRGIRRLDVHDVAVHHFGQGSSAGNDEVLSEGAGFRSRKTEPFHERRDDYRIHGRDVVAKLRVFDARNPNHVV